jgi:hypothetical protein
VAANCLLLSARGSSSAPLLLRFELHGHIQLIPVFMLRFLKGPAALTESERGHWILSVHAALCEKVMLH